LRIILVLLTCLLSTSLAAVLADEYQHHRNPNFNAFTITEMIFVLLVPLTGIFPTVEIPSNPLSLDSWGRIDLGTKTHPVKVHGLISFTLHFLGVIPFMFGLPLINLFYAWVSRHQTWVLLLAHLGIASLLLFVTLQCVIFLQIRGWFQSELFWSLVYVFFSFLKRTKGLSSDKLFAASYFCELLLVVFVSFGTLLFSFKRNRHGTPGINWDLDGLLKALLYVK
jgi:hypothetical protein